MRRTAWGRIRRGLVAAALAAGAGGGAGMLGLSLGAGGAVAPPTVIGLSPDVGPATGGTVVTVTGTGFAATSATGQLVPAVTAVHVGTTNAPDYQVVSDSELLVVTPSLVGTGSVTPSSTAIDVTVTTAAGTSPTSYVGDLFFGLQPGMPPDPCVTGPGGSDFCANGTGGSLSVGGATASGLDVSMFGNDVVDTVTVPSTPQTGWSQVTVSSPVTGGATAFTLATPSGLSGTVDRAAGTVTLQGDLAIGFTSPTQPAPCLLSQPTTFTVTLGPSPTPAPLGGAGEEQVGGTLSAGPTPGSGTSTAPVGSCNGVTSLPVSLSVPVTVDLLAPALTGVAPVAGPCAAGTAVTLSGVDLGSGTAVTFDGQPAGSVVGAPGGSSLVATLPALPAGTSSVTVHIGTGPAGTANSATYTCETVPTVTGVSPAEGPVTGGTVVLVTGTGFVPGWEPSVPVPLTGVRFGGTAAASTSTAPGTVDVVSPTELLVVAPAAASTGPVDVTVTNGMGTSPTSAADRFTYVPSLPPPSCVPDLSAAQDLCVTGTGGTADATLSAGLAASLSGFAVSLSGHVDAATGAVSVPTAGVAFGQLSGFAAALPVSATLTAAGAATGTWDAATGMLSLSVPLRVGLDVVGVALCQGLVTLPLQATVTAGPDGNLGGTLGTAGPVALPSALVGGCPVGLTGTITASVPVTVAQVPATGPPSVTALFPTSGPGTGYTLLWVFGNGLGQPGAVRVGGTRVLWRSFGAGLLLALAPPVGSAGPVDVRVTTSQGTSPVVPGDAFTYTSG